MKSIQNIGRLPAGINLISDEIVEFHAARIVLLIALCGKKNRDTKSHTIEGLTKLAKLDFFVRYPAFFNRVAVFLNKNLEISVDSVDSKMIRFHYGPWDKRYYQVLPFLEARDVIRIKKNGTQYVFHLTPLGEKTAGALLNNPTYKETVNKMSLVSKAFKNTSGSKLKELVYEVFKNEVANKSLDDIINY